MQETMSLSKVKFTLSFRCISRKEKILAETKTRGKLSGGIKREIQRLTSLNQDSNALNNGSPSNSAFVSYNILHSRQHPEPQNEEHKDKVVNSESESERVNASFNSLLPNLILNSHQNDFPRPIFNPANNWSQEERCSEDFHFNILPVSIFPQIQVNIPICMPMMQYIRNPYVVDSVPTSFTYLPPL